MFILQQELNQNHDFRLKIKSNMQIVTSLRSQLSHTPSSVVGRGERESSSNAQDLHESCCRERWTTPASICHL